MSNNNDDDRNHDSSKNRNQESDANDRNRTNESVEEESKDNMMAQFENSIPLNNHRDSNSTKIIQAPEVQLADPKDTEKQNDSCLSQRTNNQNKGELFSYLNEIIQYMIYGADETSLLFIHIKRSKQQQK